MPTNYEIVKARKEADPEYAARLKSYSERYKQNNLEKEKVRQRTAKQASREKDREAYNAYMREWTRKNSDSINSKRRELRKSNPELAKLDNERRRSQRDPEHHRNVMLKNNYGLSLDEYRQMYTDQNGKCRICEIARPDKGKEGLVVDHCHTKGHVRGLLCNNCNNGLGRFKDNISFLEKAIKYLKG